MKTHRLFGFALAVASIHCGGADSVPPGDAGASSSLNDAGGPSRIPGTSPGAASTESEAGAPCVPTDGVDDLDDDGADTNCDGADGIVGRDVYVSGVGGADTNAGTPREPLRTIPLALSKARARGGSVLVTGGAYAMEALETEGRWTITGGYGPAFIGPPQRATTTIEPGSEGLLLGKAEHATLAHLTILGASPISGAAIALRVRAKEVLLDDVVVESRDGLAGAAGAHGAVGAEGVTTGAGSCNVASPLQPRQAGNLSAAQPPQAGVAGYPAGDGMDARGVPSLSGQTVSADRGTDGRDDGLAGDRGARGGSGSGCEPMRARCAEFHRADVRGGTGGGGGCPGKPGAGGTSGGASVAVLLLEGKLVATRSQLRTGLGGSGGSGGNGGAGGAGAFGSKPEVTLSRGVLNDRCATNADDKLDANCAAYGGRGGAGGVGGHGGGGAGGWTIGIAVAEGASANVDEATQFELGPPGSGGEGSRGGRAPNGQRRSTLALPPR